MFKLANGVTMGKREAVRLVKAEGALIAYRLCDSRGGRCVMGVILDSTYANQRTNLGDVSPIMYEAVKVNNSFKGTPEERCEFMANWLESYNEGARHV